MKIIEPNVEVINQAPGIEGVYEAIARAARICYATVKKDKCKEMVERLISRKHYRPLEFGSVYLIFNHEQPEWKFYMHNPFSVVKLDDDKVYVTTNYRVIVENNLLDHLTYFHDFVPNKHDYRLTFHWTIDRGVADEFRTHTSISSLMQSTRYCNYSLDKFNNEVTYVVPCWGPEHGQYMPISEDVFRYIEDKYLLMSKNIPAECARTILPLGLKTEFIQCAYLKDWDKFFDQRYYETTGPAHPDAKFIASIAIKLFYAERKRITEEQ